MNTSNSFYKILMSVFSVIGLVSLLYMGAMMVKNSSSLKKKSGLTVDTVNGTAKVYLNDILLGDTPFSSKDITPGENTLKIKSDIREYVSTIEFIPNDSKYVHNVGIFADLGVSDLFSGIQELWFQKDKSGNSLRVVTEPSGATVYIDNSEVGKTPFASEKLSDGDYDLRVDIPGYESQTQRISAHKGYTLNIKFKMFPLPVPPIIKLLEGSTNFYNIPTDNVSISSDTPNWAKAVVYWNKTRGINIEGTGLNKDLIFDYFVDFKGNIFDNDGKLVLGAENITKLKKDKGAYLGRISDGAGITKEAKDAVYAMSGTTSTGKKATILETGTGWLRVRDNPSLNGLEVAKVNVNQEYEVLEEGTGWVKLKVSDTIVGWVSADYVKLSE